VADPTRGHTEARARGGVARSREAGAVRAGERRGDIIEGEADRQALRREEREAWPKPFAIPQQAVGEAGRRVKANRGAAGIAGESLAAFEPQLRGNLSRIWNRLAAGSDCPPPGKEGEIPQARGGVRPLGIATVGARGAQTVAQRALAPQLEPPFDPDA